MKTIGYYLAMAVLMASCVTQVEDDEIEKETEEPTVTIHITANTSYTTGEIDESRATDAGPSRMAFAVLDEDGITVASQEKDDGVMGYNDFSADLPYGAYKLVIVGHSGGKDAVIGSDVTVSFSESKLTDTFRHYQELTLDKSSTGAVEATLTRCASKFSVTCTDAIPSDVSYVTMTFTGGASFVASTGLAASCVAQTRKIDIPSTKIGKTGVSFSFFTFLAKAEENITVTATAYDAMDTPIITKTFTDVPMKVNRQTIYSGAFFKNGVEMAITPTVDTTWETAKEESF